MRRHSDLHQSAAISAVLLVLLFALPLAVVVPFQTELFSDDPIAVESEREPFQPGDLDGEMVLKVLAGDTVEEMTLGEYLVGVVRAEMPASFEPEALKAQAVAARTYTLSPSSFVTAMPRAAGSIPISRSGRPFPACRQPSPSRQAASSAAGTSPCDARTA